MTPLFVLYNNPGRKPDLEMGRTKLSLDPSLHPMGLDQTIPIISVMDCSFRSNFNKRDNAQSFYRISRSCRAFETDRFYPEKMKETK